LIEGAQLLAGAAKEDITPPVGVYMEMDGYASRRKPSTGNHDRLHARALVMDDGKTPVVLVSCDFCWVSDHLVSATVSKMKQMRSKVEHVILCATHTHSGPAIVDFLNPLNHENYQYLKGLPDRLADVIVKAESRAEPATLVVGKTDVDLSINRRYPEGPVDRELVTVTALSTARKPIAKILNYACHGTVLGPENLMVSGDFPGVATRSVEETGGGLVCLFLNGACGDINPRTCKGYNCNGSFEDMKAMGSVLAGRSVLAKETVPVNLSGRIQYEAAKIGPFPPFGMEVELSALAVGDLMMVGVPGEVFAETGISAKKGTSTGTVLVVGYANGYQGYFPTEDAYRRGDYEAKELCWVTADAERGIRAFAEEMRAKFLHPESKSVTNIRLD
jgi:neutral ceramidase